MTDDEWFFISGSLIDLQKQRDIFDKAFDAIKLTPESPLVEPFFISGSLLISSLSMIAGDDFDSLNWYVFECDFGRDPKKAGIDGDMRLIDSHDNLRWLLEVNSNE